MKFVLILGVVLLLQGVVPCDSSRLFDFFHNFLARQASTIIDRFTNKETGPESFHLFFRDIIKAHLYARGHLGWNKTLTVPPSTTPQSTTPLNELNYWRNFGRKIRDTIEAAIEKYPTNPSLVITTIGDLHCLEKTLVWHWFATELQRMTNTAVGNFISVDEE